MIYFRNFQLMVYQWKKELILLNKSFSKLSTTLKNGNLTFFCKFFGIEKDYYVIQSTKIDDTENYNYDNDMKKRKKDGINKNVL